VILVQFGIEIMMLFVFLWARILAGRAFPADPSAEAKLLIWITFTGDAFAGERLTWPD
jgi:hypothetical protein